MRSLLSLLLITPSLFVAYTAANPHGSPHLRRAHDAIARRAPGDLSAQRRSFDNSRWTFYDVGLGACGQNSSPSDFMVALNSAQYGGGYPGPNCFQQITMTYNGKTTTATILDECPGCPYGGLDLSRGLFDFFASESEGVIYGSWDFAGNNQPTTSNTPTTSSTPAYTPPTTSTTPSSTPTPTSSSTSTWSSSPPSSSDPSSSPSSSSTTFNSNSGPASNLAVPTGSTVSDSATHNLLALNEDMVALGGIVAAGARI